MIWQNNYLDSVIDDNDRIILGNAQPKWVAGLNNSVTYKQFILSFDFYISWGGSIYNSARANLNRNVTTNVTPEPDYIHKAWWHPGDVTIYPLQVTTRSAMHGISAVFILEDASFIRLRNARLSYELPKKLFQK
jgi:hypothetical protein